MIKNLKDLNVGDTFTMYADKRSTPMVVTYISPDVALTRVEVRHESGTRTRLNKPSLSTVVVL